MNIETLTVDKIVKKERENTKQCRYCNEKYYH